MGDTVSVLLPVSDRLFWSVVLSPAAFFALRRCLDRLPCLQGVVDVNEGFRGGESIDAAPGGYHVPVV